MLLQVHAKQCQNNACPVPRCRELREMRRRAVARQEDQRRVAYKAMLRQQNAQRAQQQGPPAGKGGGPPGGPPGGQGGGGASGQPEVKREAQY